MSFLLGSFVAGALAGAVLTVWWAVLASAAALLIGATSLLFGALSFPQFVSFIVLPVVVLQAGFIVSALVQTIARGTSRQPSSASDEVATEDGAELSEMPGRHAG